MREIEDPQWLGLLGMRERALLFGGEVRLGGSPGVGTTVVVGKGEGRNLLGASLPLGPGEDIQTAVLADRQPAAVGERLTEPRRQRYPALGVELIAVRAEQFGHASSPFLH